MIEIEDLPKTDNLDNFSDTLHNFLQNDSSTKNIVSNKTSFEKLEKISSDTTDILENNIQDVLSDEDIFEFFDNEFNFESNNYEQIYN